MINDECTNAANKTLMQVRNILWQADRINSDIPYMVLVALLAESSLLTEQPDAWLEDLMTCVNECKRAKMDSLQFEANASTHH